VLLKHQEDLKEKYANISQSVIKQTFAESIHLYSFWFATSFENVKVSIKSNEMKTY